jgi:hypothetical protein
MTDPQSFPGEPWPRGSRLVQLRPRSKQPYPGASGHAHLAAVADADFVHVAGANVGIVLDAMYLAVDIDRPADPGGAAWIAHLAGLGTWQQTTPRQHATPADRARAPSGRHFLFRTPPGWCGRNGKVYGEGGAVVGDLKCRGYIVAPGCAIVCDDGQERAYELVCGADPVPAPDWLLALASGSQTPAGPGGLERDAIPPSEHDNFLASLGGFLRARHGLSETGLATAMRVAAQHLLQDVDPARPYTDVDFTRLARSCAKLEAATPDVGPLAPETWVSGGSVDLVRKPVEWIVRHFVPRGELVMLFGAGGKGKSSWLSWLAAEETRLRADGRVAFFGVEEPFSRFLWRAVLAGADRERLFAPLDASRMLFPRDAPALRRAIELSRCSLVIVDSIYTHFEAVAGLNTAERARRSLGPLAEIAQQTGCTIVGNFHENKSGDYLGSTEMGNVGRMLLHAQRPGAGPLTIEVSKTNFVDPGYRLAFGGRTVPARDPLSGAIQYERLENGTLVPLEFVIPERWADEQMAQEPPAALDVDTLPEPKASKRPPRTSRDAEVR